MTDNDTESMRQELGTHRMAAVMAVLGALGEASITGLDRAIDESLEQLGRAEQVDRCYLVLFDQGMASMTHEWCAPGIEPLRESMQNLPLSEGSWWIKRMLAGDDIHIGSVAELPPEAHRERELLEAQSVKSLLSVPIRGDEGVVGFLGFDAENTARSWRGGAILLIRSAAEGLAHALARQRAEASLAENEANYRAFLESMPDLVFVIDQEGNIVYSNPAASTRLGYTPETLKTMTVADLHPPWMREEAGLIIAEMLAGRRDSCPLPLMASDGTLVPVETRASLGTWSGQDCILGIAKDLSQEQEALQKFEKLFEMNPALMAVSTIPEGAFVNINSAFSNALGYSAEELVGKTSADAGIFVNPEKQRAAAARLRKDGHLREVELRVRTKHGSIRDGLFSGEVIESQGQKYLLTVMIDITERKRLEERIKALSMTDELTGLNNRRAFMMLGEQQLKLAERENKEHALFFLDLNGMKWVNDQWGHAEGDRALVEAGTVLKDTFRETDVIARIGGDEFVVLATEVNDDTLDLLRRRLDMALRSHNTVREREYRLSFSVGIARYSPGSGVSLEGLMAQADKCMYEEKKSISSACPQ